MTFIKHTPGPWINDRFGLDGWVLDSSGNYLFEEVNSDEEEKYEQDEEKRNGNLKFAGLAPELAQALKALTEMVEKTEYAFYPEQQRAEELLRQLS